MTKENNNTFAILGVVAIIAIVAIVMLLMSSSGKGVAVAPASMMAPSTMDIEGNLVGDGLMSLYLQKCTAEELSFCLGLSSVSDATCYSNQESGLNARMCFTKLFKQVR